MTKKESFWFTIGAIFGLFCGQQLFNLSIENTTISSFIVLMLWSLIYGLTYKDIYKHFNK